VRDILTFPLLEGATFALMDIDAERLGFTKQAVDNLIAAARSHLKAHSVPKITFDLKLLKRVNN